MLKQNVHKKAVLILLFFVFSAGLMISPPKAGALAGKPFNPVTDVCWWCVFPIKLGGVQISPGAFDTVSLPTVPYGFPPPICWCPKLLGLPVPGITLSMWEPKYIFEVVRAPFTFPTFGISIPPPTPFIPFGSADTTGSGESESFYQVHAIAYPLLTMMNFVTDLLCLGSSSAVDISYVTELDPTWDDSSLATLLAPEGILLANPLGVLACIGDCLNVVSQYAAGGIATQGGDDLFWCAGCLGFNYPMVGHISQSNNQVQDSSLLTSRLIAAMTRRLQFYKTAGPELIPPPNPVDSGLMCQPVPVPFMQKTQYKLQMTFPRVTGFCVFLGTPSMAYSQFEEFPVQGEDFGYLLWQKFDCCSL